MRVARVGLWVVIATLSAACGRDVVVDLDATGSALGALGAADAVGPPSVRRPDGVAGRDPGEEAGLYWSFSPTALRVWRPTEVRFEASALPADHADARCLWTFGEGGATADGCRVTHTFGDGDRDVTVTLTVRDGSWSLSSSRLLPLERLPVTSAPASPGEVDGLPSPPRPGPTNLRIVFIADTANDSAAAGATTQALLERVRPQLLVHVGGVVLEDGGDAAWDAARDAIGQAARAANVPLVWAMSPIDVSEGARVRRPDLTLVSGADYPVRYSLVFKDTFIAVIGGDAEAGLAHADLTWLRTELDRAQGHSARFVVSHLPLHRFAEDGAGATTLKFELYELLLRARISGLVSAGHRVFFEGRYGALPVLSVGALVGPAGKLVGAAARQQPSYTVVDIISGVPERIFAVEGPDFAHLFDEAYLPETVEVYTQ